MDLSLSDLDEEKIKLQSAGFKARNNFKETNQWFFRKVNSKYVLTL